MATLHLMCGLPGPGKTRLAQQLEQSLPALRLTLDEWLTDILGPSSPRAQLDAARGPFETLQWRVAARALTLGLDVILDFGFWSRAEREDYRARASALGASSQVHLVEATEEELRHWSAVFERPDPGELRPRSAIPITIEFTCHAAPVQAEGLLSNRAFYFRARGTEWTFTIAEQPGSDPATMGVEDVETGRAWHRSGEVSGGRFAASYLPLDQARSLIHACARAYLVERAGHA